MRITCRFLALLLLAGCPLLGRAVTIRIQDPNFTNIQNSPSAFSFSVCPGANDPGGPYLDRGAPITSDGCFGGVNQADATITSITLTFEDTIAVQNSGPDVAASDIFQNASFTAPASPNGEYTFLFSGNGLVEGQTFVITEDGVKDPKDFPVVSLSYTTVTPEPSTLLLVGTGLGCVSGLYRRHPWA